MRFSFCVVALPLLVVAVVGAALVPGPAPVAAPALIRMWTAAKPCPQTQQKFGSAIGKPGRHIHVEYAHTGMGKWSAAVKDFAQAVSTQNAAGAVANAKAAVAYLKQYAKAQAAHVTALVTACATQLGGMAENDAQAITAASALPLGAVGPAALGGIAAPGVALAGGVIVGTHPATACAELCAFTSAMAGVGKGNQFKSCSAAVGRGTGKQNAEFRMGVSGGGKGKGQPANLVFPANVDIAIPGGVAVAAAALRWVKPPAPVKPAFYDSCALAAGCGPLPAAVPPVVNPNRAYSPAFEAAWQNAAGIAGNVAEIDPNPDNADHGPRVKSMARQGTCSEDRLIESFITTNTVE